MSTDAITSASDAAKRNLANARSNYNNPIKNPSLSWDGSSAGFPFVDLTGLNGAFPQVAPVNGNNNNNVTNNTVTATQNVNPISNFKDYNNSLTVNSNVNAGSPTNAQNSFVPKMSTDTATEPPQRTIRFVTGEDFQNACVEIAESVVKFMASIPKQLDLMTQIALDSSMSLWRLLSEASVAAGKNTEAKLAKETQDARDKAESAGNCAMIAGIIEAIVAAIMVAVCIVVAVAAAPETGGTSIAAGVVFVSALVGVLSSAVMVVDGCVKAAKGAELKNNAQSTGDIYALIADCLPYMQYGFFAMLTKGINGTGGVGGDPAKAQEWFTIATTIVTVFSSGAELFMTKAAVAGAEVAEEGIIAALSNFVTRASKFMKLPQISKAYSIINSSLSLGGMIGGALDPTDAAGNSDGHKHTMGLWQSLSCGVMGALIYVVFETSWGADKTLAERANEAGQYGAMIAECVTLFLLTIVGTYMQVLSMSGGFENTKDAERASRMLYWQVRAGLVQFFLQTAQQAGGLDVAKIMAELEADAMESQGDITKISSELQLIQSMVQAMTTQNTSDTNGIAKLLSQMFQSFGSVQTALKDAFDSQTKAIRANVA